MKRKILSVLVLTVAALMLFGITAFAEPAAVDTGSCGENLTYSFYDDGSLVIVGTGDMTNYVDYYYYVPWYSYSDDITDVLIDETVTSIGSYAFYLCRNLKSVTLPDSIISIGNDAFSSCRSLESITIPNSVTSIGNSAFSDCSKLESVTIGNKVESIGNSAFEYCSKLESVVIPDSVISIGDDAFFYCNSLKNVTIGKRLTNIGDRPFSSCNSLVNIIVDEDNCNFSSDEYGVLFNKDKTTLIRYPRGNERAEFIVPNGVVSIDDYAFYGCSYLKNIALPDSIKIIGYEVFISTSVYEDINNWDNGMLYIDNCLIRADESITECNIKSDTIAIAGGAFLGCQYLESITIPDSVTSIAMGTFAYCESLKSVTIGNKVESIGVQAFYGCTSIESITIPDSVVSIGDRAFENCSKLESVTIPDSVISIGYEAFSSCTSLKSVTIGNKVESIGYSAFFSCTSLKSITIPDSVTSIGNYAFYDCSKLESVTIGNKVESIGNSAFSSCTSLKSTTIPDSVTSIGDYAFYDCLKLESVTIGNKVESIGNYAFYNCDNLKSITIPDSVTSIGDYTFFGCSKLESITIPNSVTSMGSSAFSGCISIKSITVDENNEYYLSDEYGVLFNKEKTELIQYPVANERISYTISDSVTSIGDSAFSNCDSLESVTIGNKVESIGNYAFYNCDNLKSITIPDSVTSMGSSAFSGCTSIESITVDENNGYFSNDEYGVLFDKDKTELIQYPIGNERTEYTIPSSVTSINDYSFYNCSSLKSIVVPISVLSIGYSAFGNIEDFTIISYKGSAAQNYADKHKINFTELELPEDVELCGILGNDISYILYKNGALVIGGTGSMDSFSNSINSPSKSPFYNNTIIKTVTISNGITSISDYLFYNCSNLKTITIPESVTRIGGSLFSSIDNVFYGCVRLESITVDENNQNYSSDDYGALFNKDKTVLMQYPVNNPSPEYTVPDSVTSIGDSAFSGCYSLLDVVIGNKVESIGDSAFYSCQNLESVVIGNKVESIGDFAFCFCFNLESVVIGNKVESIGWDAFGYCSSLKSITIPDSVTSIGSHAFIDCESLLSITVDESNKYYSSDEYGVLFNKDKTTLIQYPAGNERTEYTIPNSVASIGDYAFSHCDNLKSIIIPDSVTSIGDSAFAYCGKLTSVEIPANVKTIDAGAFRGCSILEKINVNADNKYFVSDEYGVLFDINKTRLIQYPAGIKNEEYTVPESVTIIGSAAFERSKLKNIIIGKNVNEIDNSSIDAFLSCNYLDSITGFSGSCAEKYANSKNIKFIALDDSVCVHAYSSWQTVTAAKCSSGGSEKSVCSLCGDTITRNTSALGHNYSTSFVVDKAASCGVVGAKSRHCSRCTAKTSVTKIPALEHKYGAWQTTPATCAENGKQTRTCSICKKSEIKTIAAIEHTYGTEWIIDKTPTCTDTGSKSLHCSVCDAKSSITEIAALGHKYSEWITVEDADCTKNGLRQRTCSECNTVETENIAASGHDYGDWTVTAEPTYANNGVETRLCINCDAAEHRDIDKLVVTKEFKDETSGISVSCSDSTYEGNISVKVSTASKSENFKILQKEAGNHPAAVFDITTVFEDAEVQPNGAVLVKIPIPAGYNPETLEIYYISDDNTYAEQLPCYIEGDFICFETTHFSQYAIVDVSEELPEYVLGDVNSDGNVNAADARLALRISAELEAPTDIQLKAADADLNGKVTAADARMILRKSAGLEDF